MIDSDDEDDQLPPPGLFRSATLVSDFTKKHVHEKACQEENKKVVKVDLSGIFNVDFDQQDQVID